MKVLIVILLAEVGWLAVAVSGSTWAFLLGFVGFVVTPAIVLEVRERRRVVAS